jgi:hypothetical protein
MNDWLRMDLVFFGLSLVALSFALAALGILLKRSAAQAIRCWRVRQELHAVERETFSQLR